MKCVKCGNELDSGVRFCGACGTQQPGAVIPKAAVNTNAKTMFQGSAPVIAKPPEPASAPASPRGPVRADVGFAATIAPGTGGMPVVAPVVTARQAGAQGNVPVRQTGAQGQASNSQPIAVGAPAGVEAAPGWEGDLTGRTLNNRYLVEGKLGEGGFGAVYRARQTQMNRQVALKVLHTKMAKDPQVVGRFKREAQASSLLRAAHTVQVYDFDQTPEGVMYLSMEMLEGKSLHSIMSEGGPLDPVRVARILDGVAESLDEAHRQGIVHRDIKPENIFLEPRPTPDFVKVLDFGIAKIVSGDGMGSQPALTAAGQTLGTLEYMSPEQLMGKQLDGRSDLYALGTLAYEMLTGELPFSTKTPGEIITAHLKTVPGPPSQKVPQQNIPPLLDQIVIKLVQKSRDDRYKDTAELRGELAKIIGGGSQSGASMPAAPRASAQVPSVNRPNSVNNAPAPAIAPPPAKSGGMSPMVMIAIGLIIGVGAVLAALFLRHR
jgi:serine/threonine-protein kinase